MLTSELDELEEIGDVDGVVLGVVLGVIEGVMLGVLEGVVVGDMKRGDIGLDDGRDKSTPFVLSCGEKHSPWLLFILPPKHPVAIKLYFWLSLTRFAPFTYTVNVSPTLATVRIRSTLLTSSLLSRLFGYFNLPEGETSSRSRSFTRQDTQPAAASGSVHTNVTLISSKQHVSSIVYE